MEQSKAPKPSLQARLQGLVSEYGMIATCTYLGFSVLAVAGFAVAIQLGVKVDTPAGTVGTLAAAWLAAKVTIPLRILGTLALTPIIGKLLQRSRKQPPSLPPAVSG